MEAVPSPCILVCEVDPRSDICIGCGRTLDEIATWASARNRRRREIVRLAAARRASMRQRNHALDH